MYSHYVENTQNKASLISLSDVIFSKAIVFESKYNLGNAYILLLIALKTILKQGW